MAQYNQNHAYNQRIHINGRNITATGPCCSLNNSVTDITEKTDFDFTNYSVGMTYVPWQKWPNQVYMPGKALKVGTIFPCLDLPFECGC